jgi:hypothetical protein
MPYKDKARQREEVKRLLLEGKARKQQYIAQAKQVGCVNCGETAIECLDFHHLQPEDKRKSVAYMTHNGTSMRVLSKEIEKCVVLCANCHRKLHAGTLTLSSSNVCGNIASWGGAKEGSSPSCSTAHPTNMAP